MAKKLKGFFNKIKESVSSIIQLLILIMFAVLPFVIDISKLVGEKIG